MHNFHTSQSVSVNKFPTSSKAGIIIKINKVNIKVRCIENDTIYNCSPSLIVAGNATNEMVNNPTMINWSITDNVLVASRKRGPWIGKVIKINRKNTVVLNTQTNEKWNVPHTLCTISKK